MNKQILNNQIDEFDINSDEFIAGMRDCKNGVKHEPFKSDSYNRGYATQYELEQVMSSYGFN